MKKNNRNKLILSLLIAVAISFLSIKLFGVDITKINQILRRLDIWLIILVFILYLFCHYIRALRLKYLFNKRISIRKLFKIVGIYHMVSNLLPFRSGELSFFFLIDKCDDDRKIKNIEKLIILLLSKVFDTFAIFCLFFIGLSLTLNNSPSTIKNNLIVIVLIFSLLIIILLSITLFRKKALLLMSMLVKVFYELKKPKKLPLLNRFKEAINIIEKFPDNKKMIKIFILSLTLWSLYAIIAFTLAYMLIPNIDFATILTVSNFATIISMVPFNSFANLGIFESAWGGLLFLYGFEKNVSILSGYVIHLLIILFYTMIGISIIFISRKNRN